MKRKILLSLVFILSFAIVIGQKHREKPENFFGLQVKPLIPLGMVGDKPFTLINEENKSFSSKISPAFGYSFGGIVRVGMTELLAIETGLNITKRKYNLDYSVADSNLVAKDEVGFVSFDIPINALVYVKLGKQTFMNVSAGASMNYNPSNIWSPLTPDKFKKDVFIFKGRRNKSFDFNANAEVGFEYRTESHGAFYLGMAGKIVFGDILFISTEYQYDTYRLVNYSSITGSTFALTFKYFFHNTKYKKGVQVQKGPIE